MDSVRYRNVGPLNLEAGESPTQALLRPQKSPSSPSLMKFMTPLVLFVLAGFWALSAVLFKDSVEVAASFSATGERERFAQRATRMPATGDSQILKRREEEAAFQAQGIAQQHVEKDAEIARMELKAFHEKNLANGARMAMQERKRKMERINMKSRPPMPSLDPV
mmetsp:Transcript_1429/g.2409  ORF Transcript_1429/g.2409 Transcript_1429/m.2409 type:complete len:165 (+) Transcript_1429:67-561(+)